MFIILLFESIVLFAYLFKLFDWLAAYSATEMLNSFQLFREELQRFRWRTIYCLNNSRSAPRGIFRLVENWLYLKTQRIQKNPNFSLHETGVEGGRWKELLKKAWTFLSKIFNFVYITWTVKWLLLVSVISAAEKVKLSSTLISARSGMLLAEYFSRKQ